MPRRPNLRFLSPRTTAMHSFDVMTIKAEGKRLTEFVSYQLNTSLASCIDLIPKRRKLRCLALGSNAIYSFAIELNYHITRVQGKFSTSSLRVHVLLFQTPPESCATQTGLSCHITRKQGTLPTSPCMCSCF